ncbi:MAG: hypothetical protein NT178_07050 [Proteobacteria bacterium]|nr:hypothetical protein [Pseudomonadota bacterium]
MITRNKLLTVCSIGLIAVLLAINPANANPFEGGVANLGNPENRTPQEMSKSAILLSLGVRNIRIVANFDPAFVKDGIVLGFVGLDGEKGWIPLKKGDFIQVKDRQSFSGRGWLIPNIKEPNSYIELKEEPEGK